MQGNYAVSGGLKGIEAVEAKAKSFKARMTVSAFSFLSFCSTIVNFLVERLAHCSCLRFIFLLSSYHA